MPRLSLKTPWTMFFKWFVPYGRLGALVVALLTFPVCFGIYEVVVRTLSPHSPEWLERLFTLGTILGVALSSLILPSFSVYTFGYHHMPKVHHSILVALGAWLLWSLLCAWVGAVAGLEKTAFIVFVIAGTPPTILVAYLTHLFALRRRHSIFPPR